MSPKPPSLAVGLAALGLAGSAWFSVPSAAEESAARAPGGASQGVSSVAPQPSKQAVLLLLNGRVVAAEQLGTDGADYVLRQKLGTIRFRKRDVERVFRTMHEVYQYKRSRIPDLDPDEHFKLARWCLEMKLRSEARAELERVLELNADDPQARAMIASLDAASERAARRSDPGIVQVGGGNLGGGDQPEELSPEALQVARRSGSSRTMGLPVIFDLPPALAVRRAQEFARTVHPELQKQCVRCHDDRFPGTFQLIRARTQRDMADEMVIRHNLDATLALIDPLDPAKSPLLANSLLPHPPDGKPVLVSSKTRAYRAFATWVNSLGRAAQGPEPLAAAPAGAASLPAGPTGFAADRVPPPDPAVIASRGSASSPRPISEPLPRIPRTPPVSIPVAPGQEASPQVEAVIDGRPMNVTPLPPGRMIPNSYAGPSTVPPANLEFPTPPVVSGFRSAKVPQPGPAADAGPNPKDRRPVPTANARRSPNPPTAPLPQGVTAGPAGPRPRAQDGPTQDVGASAKPRKKSKLDQSALEKFLMSRGQR